MFLIVMYLINDEYPPFALNPPPRLPLLPQPNIPNDVFIPCNFLAVCTDRACKYVRRGLYWVLLLPVQRNCETAGGDTSRG